MDTPCGTSMTVTSWPPWLFSRHCLVLLTLQLQCSTLLHQHLCIESEVCTRMGYEFYELLLSRLDGPKSI